MRLMLALALTLLGAGSAPVLAAPLAAVPTEFLGTWHRVHEECEADSDEKPRAALPPMSIRFTPNHEYVLREGTRKTRGRFVMKRYRSGMELQLADSLLEFDLRNGRLENWSEGEAVYLCGQIFERSRKRH